MKSFQQIQEILPPLPEIKRIYLLGSTGAGKTSIVRNIIGTSALNFPTTTQTRTTLATTEYVIKSKLPFKTTIILKQKTDVLDAIEELIQDTIQKALENKRLTDIDYITEKLQESADERFRLRYMVNDDSLRSHATNISENIIPLLEGKSLDDETLFSNNDVEPKITHLINSILKEIEDNFSKVCSDNNYMLFSDEPYYIENIIDKARFIQRNKELLKNEFGSISLLVEYVRIEGDLLADWLDNTLEFVLIDGEGIAHSLQEKRDTLSTRHYDYFDFCNQILLVEKADDPFISGGQAAIEAILLNGYKNKFKLIFSKIDKIENTDKNSFLKKRLENLKAALKDKKITLELENKDSYKLDNLNENKTSDYSKSQIKKLLKNINESEGCDFIPLEYDFSTFFLNIDTTQFIKNFQNDYLDAGHWAVIKAFSKRMYNQEGEYKHIKLITFILTFIMKDVDAFLKREDQTKAEIYNSKNIIKQQFSKQLLAFIRQEFMIKKRHLWQQAFEKKGIGSSKERKLFILDNILKDFLPEKENHQKFDVFKKNIRELLLNSGAEILASAKKIVIKEVKIEGIYGHKNFSWKLGENINVLLGKNGSGKSTILKLIYACITNDKAIFDYFESPYVTLIIEKKYDDEKTREFTITNSNSSNIDAQMVNTFDATISNKSVGTELDVKLEKLIERFGEHIRVLKSNLDNETKSLATEIDSIISNISSATDENLTRFKDLKTEIDKIKEEKFKRLKAFNDVINSFYKDTNKAIEVDKEKPLIVKMNANEGITNIEISKLSSGEKQLLIIFLTVVLQGDNAFILLMDEPESSLHVEWQSMLLDSLKRLNDNIQIIIATHNPLLALNRKCNEIGRIEVDSDIVQTEGVGTKYLDVSATLLNYFHLSSLVGIEMKEKLRNLFKLKTQEALSEDEKITLDVLEKELGNTLATNFIYDRHYLHFLRFIKENYQIDFDKLTEISEEEMDKLLGEFKGLFDD